MPRHCAPGCPHLHFSTLKHFGRSPAHYHYYAEHGMEPTYAMHLGTAIHNLVLENGDSIVLFDGKSRRGKAWDAFVAEQNPDSIILTEAEHDTATMAARSLGSHRGAIGLLHGLKEQRIEWTLNGRPCRGTVDAVNGNMVELKSTNDARPEFFSRLAMRLYYFAQLAWYIDGYNRDVVVNPVGHVNAVDRAFIVAVETSPPFVVQTFELTPNALDFGRKQYRLWLEGLAVCEASGEWPGYVQADVPLDSPEEFALQFDGELVEVA
jgi:PDDEXK-like domain of unknown function (DUF3799)